jgi:hypothetical protein
VDATWSDRPTVRAWFSTPSSTCTSTSGGRSLTRA